jgi:hypothetical protein
VVVDLRVDGGDIDTKGNRFWVGVASGSLVGERNCDFLSTSAAAAAGVWLAERIE